MGREMEKVFGEGDVLGEGDGFEIRDGVGTCLGREIA